MKKLILLVALLPGVAFASQMIQPVQTQLDSQAVASNDILNMLRLLHTDLQTGQNKQQGYFNQYLDNEKKKLTPKGNHHFLFKDSLYPAFGKSYVDQQFPEVQMLGSSERAMAYSFICSGEDALKDARCTNRTPKAAQMMFSSLDSSNIMPVEGQSLNNFTFSPGSVNAMVDTASNPVPGVGGRVNEFPAASLAYHVLNSIGNQYDTSEQGTQSAGYQPSQMQKLKAAVQAPFSKEYIQALSHASNPEATRALTEVAAEGNVMKFKQIKQGNNMQALLSAILLQQMRTNKLLNENLQVLQKLAKHQKNL